MSLALSIALAILAAYATVVTILLFRNPLPIPDRGFRIYSCPSVEAQQAIVKLLASGGLKPRYRIDSRHIRRVLMDDGFTVITYTDTDLHQRMGSPSSGLARVVKDPAAAASAAVRQLREAGFEAHVLGELDESVPPGSMVFVSTTALEGTVLVFRLHVLKMGPQPPRWREVAT